MATSWITGRLQHAEVKHRRHEDAAGAERDNDCRRVHALIKAGQAHQPERAYQRDAAADNQQQRNRKGCPCGQTVDVIHSMISPRIMNLARAMVDTKPSRAISMAMSK